MKKKLDTRFPAARIKKIMQADDDVGKIAMAVPLLISKALEIFLKDLCDRTYEITLKKGAKTVNSLHLKQCVQTCNVFDFLRETVSKVPDLDGSDTSNENQSACKRSRKVDDDDSSDSEEKPKRTKIEATENAKSNGRGRGRSVVDETGNTNSSGRGRGRGRSVVNETGNTNSSGRGRRRGGGRGRGRGRGRPRGRKTLEREITSPHGKFEDDPDISDQEEENNISPPRPDNAADPHESKENIAEAPIRGFDLNIALDENGDFIIPSPAPASPVMKPVPEIKHEENSNSFIIPTASPGIKHDENEDYTSPAAAPTSPVTKTVPEMKDEEEFADCPLTDIVKMGIDPAQFTNFNGRIDEDEEDYDEDIDE